MFNFTLHVCAEIFYTMNIDLPDGVGVPLLNTQCPHSVAHTFNIRQPSGLRSVLTTLRTPHLDSGVAKLGHGVYLSLAKQLQRVKARFTVVFALELVARRSQVH